MVEGPGSLSFLEGRMAWAIHEKALLGRGVERVRRDIRHSLLKQVGVSTRWPPPSNRSGTYILMAYERFGDGTAGRISGGLSCRSKRAEDLERIQGALFSGYLAAAHWEPNPENAGWNLWWFPEWIRDQRRALRVPEPRFSWEVDDYILWYRASLGLVGDRQLGQTAVTSLHTLFQAIVEYQFAPRQRRHC